MNNQATARLACIWEATARKVGNVHPSAAFADVEYMTFLTCALSIPWRATRSPKASIGEVVYDGVVVMREYSPSNTHLGILLLLAPLIASSTYATLDFRKSLGTHLRAANRHDTARVYEAIRLANPGGLGRVPIHDVHEIPTVPLRVAMQAAADRDLIAKQYVNDFADVLDFGVPAFLAAFERYGCVEAAIIDSQLQWLATYPDSLIARKKGPAIAERVRKRAAEVQKLGGIATAEGRAAGVAFDKHLRSDGNKLNPGTTADLITASLFVALREGQVPLSAPFQWKTEGWL